MLDVECEASLVCPHGFCAPPVTACVEHSDCFSTRVEGYLPECDFDSGKCANVKESTCVNEVSCASEAKSYEEVVNTQTINIKSTDARAIVDETKTAIKQSNISTTSSIRISATETYRVNITVLIGATTNELTDSANKVACGDVQDQCGTTVSNRRRLSESEEIVTIALSFDLDEAAYDKMIETGVNPGSQNFVALLALELNVEEHEIELSEYAVDMYAVEVLVTERFSQLYTAAVDTINTISDVLDDIIASSSFEGDNVFDKQINEQCPASKTCNYRGTCGSLTGICECVDGFTGLLCETAEGSILTTVHTDESPVRISNAHVSGSVAVGGTAVAAKRTTYYFDADHDTLSYDECPQPTLLPDVDEWALVFATSISQTGGAACIVQSLNRSSDTFVCCFVRGFGMLPMYQYWLDEDESAANGDEIDGAWYAIDGDGNSKQNTDSRAPTTSPTESPLTNSTPPTARPTTASIIEGDNGAGAVVIAVSVMVPFAIAVVYVVGNVIMRSGSGGGGGHYHVTRVDF